AALIIAVVGATLWPCLPGSYDPLALPLSMMARFASWALLLLVPIGAIWWWRDRFFRRAAASRLLGGATIGVAVAVGAVIVVTAAAFSGFVLALVSAVAVGAVIRG